MALTSASGVSRVALVTGGSRGIGRACAQALARDGWSVAIQYRSQSAAADALAKELQADGVKARAFSADLAQPGAADPGCE